MGRADSFAYVNPFYDILIYPHPTQNMLRQFSLRHILRKKYSDADLLRRSKTLFLNFSITAAT